MSCFSISCISTSGRKLPCIKRSRASLSGVAALAVAICTPALAGGPETGQPAPATGLVVVEGGPAATVASGADRPARSAGTWRTSQQRLQVRPDSSVQDMQEMIDATRSLARSTRTTADSLGMDQDRLTGILSRLDSIEAKVRQLDAPASHPAAMISSSGRR